MTKSPLFAAFLALAATLGANATTYQVGPGRALTQLTQVANIVNPGDVVEVDGNATYNAVSWNRDGSAAQPITIRGMAFGTARPVINAGGAADAFRMDVSHYVVEDLVISNAATRCVYMHGNNLTLRRVVVHTCTTHGILGADQDTGDMLLTEVEVFNQGNSAAPNDGHHPIYISTDQVAFPNAVLRIEKSWIHDNFSGNSIKSRAKNVKVFYNWIEATNQQASVVELIGPDPDGAQAGGLCPVPNGSNDALLCNGEMVGNVLIARGQRAFMVRLGSDATGDSLGRYHLVNNTFIANGVFAASNAMIRAFGPLQSIEMHNNIFWIQNGDTAAMRIVRDVEAEWTNGRRVTGTKNVITGTANAYAQEPALSAIQGLTNTVFVPTAGLLANVNAAALAAPATLDARLTFASAARLAGNAGNTSTAGFQIPNPTNLPALQPTRIRPDVSRFGATQRPLPTDASGDVVPNAISAGAFEFATTAGDLSADAKGDLVFQNADGRIAAWTMNGTAATATANLIGAGAGWTVTHIADLDGDGKGDIFFKHTDGRVYVYRMDGVAVIAGKELLGAGLGWSVTHTADLNGDGKADLLLRNADGRAFVWTMDGTTMTGSASLLPAASGWNVVGTGDLNGDGKADIVFMHDDGRGYIYLMNGTTIVGGAGFLSPGSGWTVSHIGDFDGDGKSDLVFRHTDGSAYLFLMNGTTFGAGTSLLGPGTGWSVSHVGDLNGDGKDDLVFKHTDGRAHVRLMNGTAIVNAGDVLPAASGWSVTNLYDLNGDGKKDLLFRHTDGTIVVRLMNGLTTIGSATLIGAGGWSVAPPSP